MKDENHLWAHGMILTNPRLRLHILAQKKPKNIFEKGFTLVELMVVVAIIGVLTAIALPAFTGAQAKAKAGAVIGTMAGFAKECAVKAVVDDTAAIAGVPSAQHGISITHTDTDCSDGSSFAATFTAGEVTGLKCGSTTAGATASASATNTTCTFTITTDGSVTGAWS